MFVAHGVGGAQDLPIPASYAIAGAGAALAVSFMVMALAWRRPRFDPATAGRPVPTWLAMTVDAPATTLVLRGVGLLFFGYVGWAATAGPPDVLRNPAFGVVYVWLWAGIVPASLVLGPIYRAVSPARTLALLVQRLLGDRDDSNVVPLPSWVGYWPAAGGLFAFVWLELVGRSDSLGPLRVWFIAYLALMLIGSALFGTRWLSAADPFEVYSTLVGHLAVVGRRADGTLVFRSPLGNLATLRPAPGLVAVVAVLLGSTAFDSFAASSRWLQFSQSTDADMTLLNTGLLFTFCAGVALTFAVATMASRMHPDTRRSHLPRLLAHSVVPIVVGYMLAHYLKLLVETGQQTLVQLSDPMGTGADLLGTADLEVNFALSTHPTSLWVLKVLAVVTGHLLGVIAAHDRALRLLPTRHQVSGQLPLLLVMISYTTAGLFLLFNG